GPARAGHAERLRPHLRPGARRAGRGHRRGAGRPGRPREVGAVGDAVPPDDRGAAGADRPAPAAPHPAEQRPAARLPVGLHVGDAYLADVERRAWAYVRDSVADYERIHGAEHPVRAWERGEVETPAAVG